MMSNPGAQALVQFRDQHNKSQLEIAHALETYPQYVGQWERGEKPPTLGQAIKLERLTDGAVPCMIWEQACQQIAA